MEDAYVIGIRLALENGVSAGLATVTADLSAIDAQVAKTEASLRRLAAVAAISTAAVSGAMRPETPAQLVKTPDISDPLKAPSAMAATAAKPAAPPILQIVQASPVAQGPHDSVGQPNVMVPLQATPATSQTAAPRDIWPDKLLQPHDDRSATLTGASAAIAAPQNSMPAPAAPVTAGPRPFERAVPATPSSAQIDATIAAPQPSVQAPTPPMVPVAKHQDNAPTTAPIRRTIEGSKPAHPIAPLPTQAPAQPQSPIAPTRAIFQATTQPNPTAPSTNPMPSVAPQNQPAAQGPISGDVYLDGSRLGQWMANHLARETARPPTGSTGFDPRMGIVWPGTQQGG